MSDNPQAQTIETFTGYAKEANERAQALNEQLVAAAKKASISALDVQQKTVAAYVEYRVKAAGVTRLDWVQSLVRAENDFLTEVTSAYAAATRSALD